MIIYIDADYKCHTSSAEGLTVAETDFFDGKCRTFIEGYRFVPADREWHREDGAIFRGEMASPWKDYSVLAAAQAQYEETLAEMQDMQEALELLDVTPTEVV